MIVSGHHGNRSVVMVVNGGLGGPGSLGGAGGYGALSGFGYIRM